MDKKTFCSENDKQNCGSCNSCTDDYNNLLSGLYTEDRSHLDENRIIANYKKGEIIFKENTYPSGLFCLKDGKVMISKSDALGNRIVTNLHKGVTFIGLADFLSGQYYQSTCQALSDVHVCMIKSQSVEELMTKNSSFSRRLLSTIAKDYQQSNSRLLAITKKNMNARIADALLELLDLFGADSDGYIDVYLKRSEIAIMSFMNETNVIRQLSILKDNGSIALEGKRIKIINKDRLLKESLGIPS